MRSPLALTLLCAAVAASFVHVAHADEAAERAPGEPECSVPGRRVFPAHIGVDPVLERAGKALVATEKPFHLAFLSLPGCKLEPIFDADGNWPAHPISITTAGDVLYDNGTQSAKGVMLRRAGGEARRVDPPADVGKSAWTPMLSEDGSALVWFAAKEGNDGQTESRIFVRELASGAERSILLDPKSRGYELVAANVGAGEYVVCADANKIFSVDGDGQKKGQQIEVSSLERCSASFRRLEGGWIAWDNLRLDNRAVRLQWSLPDGKDSHEFPLASIESVSVLPDGKRVAVSAPAADRQTNRGAVLVLSLPDGKVLFQRELEPFSRPAVSFLDSTHLAVTAGSHVEVIFIP